MNVDKMNGIAMGKEKYLKFSQNELKYDQPLEIHLPVEEKETEEERTERLEYEETMNKYAQAEDVYRTIEQRVTEDMAKAKASWRTFTDAGWESI